jgi:transketolase
MGADTSERSQTELEELAVNVVRGLSMDGPQRAGNGHPGTAMALAPLAHVLFHRVMKHDPSLPEWHDRDRFVLSCGHASILLYAHLYLNGYGLTLDDLKDFRQLGSRTPGHPERLHAPGIETTTGPLGQGLGSAVGMAMAEEHLRAQFGADVCDHHTFVICSDGDLQEGISHEAASLAGHLGLGRLVVVWDDNHISIDGPTELSWSDNTPDRFRAYGWDVDEVGEIANDLDALEAAVRRGMEVTDKPTFIALRSHIGWPSALVDTEKAHGEPLGEDNVKEAKTKLGLPPDEDFYVPDEVLELYKQVTEKGQAKRAEWEQRLASLPDDRREAWEAAQERKPLKAWADALPSWKAGEKVATRKAGAAVLEATKDLVPGLIVGGADLTGNTGVKIKVDQFTKDDRNGKQVHYGIREHGMAAAMNGMAAHGGIIPVGGTFFIFSDYCRPAIRLAALSDLKVVYSFSHDSIGLGPDGPTHQPIEQLSSLRAMPALTVIRPADANETAHAYRVAFEADGPTAIILTRQDVPVLEGTEGAYEGVVQGAYVLKEDDEADLTLIGTGSEVQLCLAALPLLAERGIRARVVSMPSWEMFEDTSDEVKEEVLPTDIPALAVEAGASLGWERWAEGVIAIDRFGSSGPGDEVMAHFGFTAQNVADEAENLVSSLRDDDDEDDEDDDD